MKRRTTWYTLTVCLLMALAACAPAPLQPASTPGRSSENTATARPVTAAPTATLPPRPTSTLRATAGPTTPPIQYPTRTSAPISLPTLTITAIPPSALPTLNPLTDTPSSQATVVSLIPPSAPRVYETTVTLTTYGYEPAFVPSSQDDPIYPYPHLNWDRVGPPAPKSYRAIVLENGYTQVTVLPELGGRIWRILDKTTGRTVTYQNPVVKPTSWGYRGWWLAAGGIEWCLPVEEHGLNEYRPWNVSISGSSITVSDHEDRTGLDVAVTIGLDSLHSYVTILPRVTNSTGSPQKMQFWENAMLALGGNHATDATRFILPASQVTVHTTGDGGLPGPGGKLDWPVFKGRDLSRYANWRGYLGFFASPAASSDFVGAYDTSSDQGIVRVFPSINARGVKFFGGKGIDPTTWTDDGSTYFELWGGLLPTFGDYTTIQPGQSFGWTERWYPVSGLGQGFDTANATAALRLTGEGDGASVGVATSVNFNGQVKLWQDGQVIATWQVAVGPGRSFNVTQPGTSGVLGLQLLDSTGRVHAQTGSVP